MQKNDKKETDAELCVQGQFIKTWTVNMLQERTLIWNSDFRLSPVTRTDVLWNIHHNIQTQADVQGRTAAGQKRNHCENN